MIHWPDNKVDIRRPLEVLAKAQAKGQIKHLGLANTNLTDLALAQQVAKIEVAQNEFSLLARDAEKLFPYLAQNKISFMSWGTLAKGIISGRVTPERQNYAPYDCRRKAFWWKQSAPPRMQVMAPVLHWCQQKGVSGLALALAFNLQAAPMHCLIGLKTAQDVQQAVAALKHLPSPALVQEALAMIKAMEAKLNMTTITNKPAEE
jgi:aryl-alcohol dehydrogenase-like predicted oxidoreductase